MDFFSLPSASRQITTPYLAITQGYLEIRQPYCVLIFVPLCSFLRLKQSKTSCFTLVKTVSSV